MPESLMISCQNYVMLTNKMHTFQINSLLHVFYMFRTSYVHHQEENIVKVNKSLHKYVYRFFLYLNLDCLKGQRYGRAESVS